MLIREGGKLRDLRTSADPPRAPVDRGTFTRGNIRLEQRRCHRAALRAAGAVPYDREASEALDRAEYA